MDIESRSVLRKGLIDVFVLICVAFPILAFHLWVTPHHRGYLRDDPSLSLPFFPSTIPTWLIALIGITLNFGTIVGVELARNRRGLIVPKQRLGGYSVPVWLIEVYQTCGVLLFGGLCQQLTTTVGKYSVGRLRPHFFSVCEPLANYTLPENAVYVQEYTCQGTADAGLLREVRLSFPSAHAAFSAYTFIFFAMYMYCRFKWGSKLLLHGIQFAAVLFAWYTGMTRVADNMHHASDVAAGFLIGTLYAIVVFVYVSHLGRLPRRVMWNPETTQFGAAHPGRA